MIRTRRTTVGRDLEHLLRDGVRPARSDAYLLDRYLGERDEAAFEILVERHGPMVLSLCRRYLRDPRDVEDAFQATFLVLARKGPGLRDKSSLSSWLYGVAYRVAMRARSDVLKRRTREIQSDAILQAPAPPTNPPDDSLETLDAELSRLPEKYRAPLVLCYLEGRTHEQAAAELGWPVGTVRSRMARARAILETRLTRRGLDASACLAVLRPEFLDSSLTATIPPSLVRAVLGGGGIASVASTSSSWPASALAQGVLTAMLITHLKWIGVGATAFGLVAATAGMGAWATQGAPGGPQTTERAPSAAPQPAQAPMTDLPPSTPGTQERLIFDEGTKAYKAGDFGQAVIKFKEGLELSNDNLKDQMKDIGLIVKRYVRALRQLGEPIPESFPFRHLLVPPEADTTVDPFDAVEMSGVGATEADVRDRLKEMERKIDRLTELLQRNEDRWAGRVLPPRMNAYGPPWPSSGAPAPAPTPASVHLPSPRADATSAAPPPVEAPAPAPVAAPPFEVRTPASVAASAESRRPAPAASAAFPDLVPSRRGIREIELALQRVYQQKKRLDGSSSNGAAHYSNLMTEEARVLVAQLDDMEDEYRDAESGLRRIKTMLEDAHNRQEKMRMKPDQIKDGAGKTQLEYELRIASLHLDQLSAEWFKAEHEFAGKQSRQRRVEKLVKWAEENFKGLRP